MNTSVPDLNCCINARDSWSNSRRDHRWWLAAHPTENPGPPTTKDSGFAVPSWSRTPGRLLPRSHVPPPSSRKPQKCSQCYAWGTKWIGFPRDQLKISGIPFIHTSSNFIYIIYIYIYIRAYIDPGVSININIHKYLYQYSNTRVWINKYKHEHHQNYFFEMSPNHLKEYPQIEAQKFNSPTVFDP